MGGSPYHEWNLSWLSVSSSFVDDCCCIWKKEKGSGLKTKFWRIGGKLRTMAIQFKIGLKIYLSISYYLHCKVVPAIQGLPLLLRLFRMELKGLTMILWYLVLFLCTYNSVRKLRPLSWLDSFPVCLVDKLRCIVRKGGVTVFSLSTWNLRHRIGRPGFWSPHHDCEISSGIFVRTPLSPYAAVFSCSHQCASPTGKSELAPLRLVDEQWDSFRLTLRWCIGYSLNRVKPRTFPSSPLLHAEDSSPLQHPSCGPLEACTSPSDREIYSWADKGCCTWTACPSISAPAANKDPSSAGSYLSSKVALVFNSYQALSCEPAVPTFQEQYRSPTNAGSCNPAWPLNFSSPESESCSGDPGDMLRLQ